MANKRPEIEDYAVQSLKQLPNSVIIGIPALFSTAIPLVSGYLDQFFELISFIPFIQKPTQEIVFHVVILLYFVLPLNYMLMRLIRVRTPAIIIASVGLLFAFWIAIAGSINSAHGWRLGTTLVLYLVIAGATIYSSGWRKWERRRPPGDQSRNAWACMTTGGKALSLFLLVVTSVAILIAWEPSSLRRGAHEYVFQTLPTPADSTARSLERIRGNHDVDSTAFDRLPKAIKEAKRVADRVNADNLVLRAKFRATRLGRIPYRHPSVSTLARLDNEQEMAASLVAAIPEASDSNRVGPFLNSLDTWVKAPLASQPLLQYLDSLKQGLTEHDTLATTTMARLDSNLQLVMVDAIRDTANARILGSTAPPYLLTLDRAERHRSLLIRDFAGKEDQIVAELNELGYEYNRAHANLHALAQELLAGLFVKTQTSGFYVFFGVFAVLIGYYFAPIRGRGRSPGGPDVEDGGEVKGDDEEVESQVDYQKNTCFLGIAILALLLPALMSEVKSDRINVQRPAQSFADNNWYLPTTFVQSVVPIQSYEPERGLEGVRIVSGGGVASASDDSLQATLSEMQDLIVELQNQINEANTYDGSRIGLIQDGVTRIDTLTQNTLTPRR